MARLDPIPVDQLSPRQKDVHDRIVSGRRGRVRGPLALWLYNPELAERAQHLGELLRFGTSFAGRLSELAILVVSRHWTSQYEWYAHAPIAERDGLSAGVVNAIRLRQTPDFERPDEAAVYRFSTEMLERGTVRDETYLEAKSILGETGIIELTCLLGYYTLGAFTLEHRILNRTHIRRL
jgi:4-carboxymuconolactone decarboxylase